LSTRASGYFRADDLVSRLIFDHEFLKLPRFLTSRWLPHADLGVPYARIERIVTPCSILLSEPSSPEIRQGASAMIRKLCIALLLLIATSLVGVGAQVARAQDMGGANMGGTDMDTGEADVKTPPPTLATGTWCGPITDALHGSGGFFITFNQNKAKLDGTWSTDVTGFSGGKTGTFTGKIKSDGETVTLKLKQPGQKGGFMFMGTLINDHNLTGTYSTFGRKPADSGSLNPESPCV
jgi:hypothetical protein